MSIETDIKTYLLTKAAFTSLVGSGSSARIYPGFLPAKTTYPAVAYRRISRNSEQQLSGAAGVDHMRMQFDVFHSDYDSAKSVVAVLRDELDGFGPGTMGSSNVKAIQSGSELDLPIAPNDGSDNWLWQIACDYMIHYDESIPAFT